MSTLPARDSAWSRKPRAAGRLHHPNIVTVFDAGEHDNQPFIAMEFVRGETLGRLIRRGPPMPLARRLSSSSTPAQALAHAHRAGVVPSRDIKPDNLMLDETGVVKVLDFGIARVMKTRAARDASAWRHASLHVAGADRQPPPDRRSDVFHSGARCSSWSRSCPPSLAARRTSSRRSPADPCLGCGR